MAPWMVPIIGVLAWLVPTPFDIFISFKKRFPCNQPLGYRRSSAVKRRAVSCVPPMKQRKLRVLVQDDEEAIRQIMCSMLTAAGYQCRQASSPKKAWAIIKSEKEIELVALRRNGI
jgi:PleD family two-component response regulator